MPNQPVIPEGTVQPRADQSLWASQALAFCIGRISQNMVRLADFPEFTRGDQWACVEDGAWVGGHWVGLLWLAFAYTGDRLFESQAIRWASRLASRQFDTTTHDLGFLFELSHILGANLTGNADLNGPAL